MKALLAWWERLCTSSKILRFVDINLRGIGQVMFQNNPLTGLIFFVAIGWGSYAAGMPQVAIAGLVCVIAATLTAQWLHVDEAGLASGLYGYNAYLVGLALATFLAAGPLLWIYVLLGGAVSVVATLATANMFKTWGVAALTAPFVLVTWLLLLASFAFSGNRRQCAGVRREDHAYRPGRGEPAQRSRLRAGGPQEHFPGVPQG